MMPAPKRKRRSLVIIGIIASVFCLVVILLFSYSQYFDRIPASIDNVDVIRTAPFSINLLQGELGTDIEGTVFSYKDDGNVRNSRLVATFNIDENDRDGIFIRFPAPAKVISYEWDYRSSEPNPWEAKSYVEHYPLEKSGSAFLISRAEEHEPPSGGGHGVIVVDFQIELSKTNDGEPDEISVAIGKDGGYADAERITEVIL